MGYLLATNPCRIVKSNPFCCRQHRVANSLQIIASILLLKARTVQRGRAMSSGSTGFRVQSEGACLGYFFLLGTCWVSPASNVVPIELICCRRRQSRLREHGTTPLVIL
jgi:hypothetical protein